MREELFVLKKMVCVLLAALMIFSVVGCGNGNKKADKDYAPYIGTWQGDDHDNEEVVSYLIFDEGGYWKIYMDYEPLVKAIRQRPDQLVSFSVFCKLQNSAHTGCYYEYISIDSVDYTEIFSFDDGALVGSDESVLYEKISTHSGTPGDDVVNQARDLFDRALIEANEK